MRSQVQHPDLGHRPTPQDVLISGERTKLNVIRADRADGIYLSNFTIEYSDFNNIYVLETNGFRWTSIMSRYSREYGVPLVHVRPRPLRELEAFGSGDSGIYPGSGPRATARATGSRSATVNSHDNTLGYSGTAGNGVWAHDNAFHHNATGMTTDSFAAGHPGHAAGLREVGGQPIYSNNEDYFNDERDAYCKNTPVAERDPTIVCPTFQVPVGTGIGIFGGNGDIVRDNYIYDNWRDGIEAALRPALAPSAGAAATTAPTRRSTTSSPTTSMGVRPDGTRDPNGNDFWWDEEGKGNCWQGNTGPDGAKPTSDRRAPDLPELAARRAARAPAKTASPGPVRDLGSQGQHRPARL